jgi:hypothetical protein
MHSGEMELEPRQAVLGRSERVTFCPQALDKRPTGLVQAVPCRREVPGAPEPEEQVQSCGVPCPSYLTNSQITQTTLPTFPVRLGGPERLFRPCFRTRRAAHRLGTSAGLSSEWT